MQFCKLEFALYIVKKQYFCIVFFMVLDLRLNEKIGLSGDNLLFLSFVVRQNNKR